MGSGWLKALEVRGPSAFLGFLAALLVSLGYRYGVWSFGALPAWAAGVANVATVLFAVLSVPWLFSLAGKPFRQAKAKRERTAEIDKHLSTLTLQEGHLFWKMVSQGKRTTYGPNDGGGFSMSNLTMAHQGLWRRGLLETHALVGYGTMYRVPDDVWRMVEGEKETAAQILRHLPALPSQSDF